MPSSARQRGIAEQRRTRPCSAQQRWTAQDNAGQRWRQQQTAPDSASQHQTVLGYFLGQYVTYCSSICIFTKTVMVLFDAYSILSASPWPLPKIVPPPSPTRRGLCPPPVCHGTSDRTDRESPHARRPGHDDNGSVLLIPAEGIHRNVRSCQRAPS